MLLPFSKKFNKKQYFLDMVLDAEKVIADLEFKKYTALGERETTRRQYDQGVDALNRLGAQLNNPNLSKDDKANLEAQKESVIKTVNDLKKHLDAIDGTVVGSAPTELLPDGAEGIDNKLKSWVQRREYIKGFIKSNC
jgi:hypothetical protein